MLSLVDTRPWALAARVTDRVLTSTSFRHIDVITAILQPAAAKQPTQNAEQMEPRLPLVLGSTKCTTGSCRSRRIATPSANSPTLRDYLASSGAPGELRDGVDLFFRDAAKAPAIGCASGVMR